MSLKKLKKICKVKSVWFDLTAFKKQICPIWTIVFAKVGTTLNSKHLRRDFLDRNERSVGNLPAWDFYLTIRWRNAICIMTSLGTVILTRVLYRFIVVLEIHSFDKKNPVKRELDSRGESFVQEDYHKD